jgi:hypothetical protein
MKEKSKPKKKRTLFEELFCLDVRETKDKIYTKSIMGYSSKTKKRVAEPEELNETTVAKMRKEFEEVFVSPREERPIESDIGVFLFWFIIILIFIMIIIKIFN